MNKRWQRKSIIKGIIKGKDYIGRRKQESKKGDWKKKEMMTREVKCKRWEGGRRNREKYRKIELFIYFYNL